MNNKGYSMVEMLGCLCVMAILFTIGFVNIKGTFSKTVEDSNNITDKEIYNASKLYIMENNIVYLDNYVCLNTDNLYDKGYLTERVDFKLIKVERDSNTKTITKISYVDSCE